MTLERWMQLGMAAMVALSSVLLGISAHGGTMPYVAAVAAFVAIYVNDFRGWLPLSQFFANFVAIFALIMTVGNMERLAGDVALLSMSDLLIYLQLILLWKPKSVRDYWLLLLANLLQTSVAAALNFQIVFSFVLVIYLLVGVATLSLFHLVREHELWRQQLTPLSRQRFASPTRWPLASVTSGIAASPASDMRETACGRELLQRLWGVTWGTCLITMVIFVLMPRFGQINFRSRFAAASQMVGFSEEVTLGELGKISESEDVALSIWLSDALTGEPMQLTETPLWHGNCLTRYERGKWEQPTVEPLRAGLPVIDEAQFPLAGYVRQRIRFDDRETKVLCCLYPPIRTRRDGGSSLNFSFSQTRDQLVRRSLQEEVTLLTAGVRHRRQAEIVPKRGEMTPDERAQLLELPTIVDGVDPLASLKAEAQRIVEPIRADEPIRRARAIESYLQDPRRFSYTLSPPARDPELDPIEDFIRNNPRGHCEYFASAAALMLRASGIPARVIVGFKGGDFDVLEKAYRIQQLHAHAWVEAYLEADQVPEYLTAGALWDSVPLPDGGWLRIDPTPVVGTGATGSTNPLYLAYRTTVDYARALWSNYVLGLDANTQREVIYQPLLDLLRGLVSVEAWRGAGEACLEWGNNLVAELRSTQAPWRPLLLLASSLFLTSYGLWRGGRWLADRLPRWTRSRVARPADIPFYRTLETILARRGFVRQRQQTAREFAFHVGGQLADHPETQGVAGLPRRISEAYYRVRFAGRTLDSDEAREVEQALSRLAESLQARPAPRQ